MPFDGAGFVPGDSLQKIDEMIELIGTPGRWAKGSFRTLDGRYCLRGAIREVDRSETLGPVILEAINQVAGRRYCRIEAFNDSPRTNHEQIITVLMRARESVVAGQFVTKPTGVIKSSAFARCWSKARGWFGS